MAESVIMPKQGNSVEAVILLEWKKDQGEWVQEGEVLCEVETDKATFEVPSTVSGVLVKKLYNEGDDVPVMQEFALIDEAGQAAGAEGAKEPIENQAAEKGDGAVGVASPVVERRAAVSARDEADLTGKRDVRISPLARSTAATLGIDHSQYREITGSGPQGRILKRDVEAFARRATEQFADSNVATTAEDESAKAPRGSAGPKIEAAVVETVKVKGTREAIAQRMLDSLTQSAQLTINALANATELTGYRKKLKAAPESFGVSDITLNDLIMFIVARVLARHTTLNAHYVSGQPDEIRRYGSVNLGFAVDDERGLYVPVIRGADKLTLRQLADRAHELVAAVRAGNADSDQLRGATFTVTNMGAYGVRDFTPVLNPPEVGILGIGTIRPEQAYQAEQIVTAPHVGLSLTFDHRATDGGPAARFLQDVVTAMSNAESVLAL